MTTTSVRYRNTEETFWSRTRPADNGCLEWTGTRHEHGYGLFKFRSAGFTRAHRLAYQFKVGPIPEGAAICHRCDNPACVNHEHLFVGTMKDNTRDMMSKGRQRWNGPRPGNAHSIKINVVAVRVMRFLRERGVSYGRLARAYKLHKKTVRDACVGKTWRHA